jgi:predicted ribosome quality control (RQC) complex YloA/Tae2 family protein
LKNSDLTLVKFFANKFGLGGKYAEEFCLQLNIDKNKPTNTVTTSEIETIFQFCQKFAKQPIDAHTYYSENVCEDFAPFKLLNTTLTPNAEESFTKALEKYFTQHLEGVDEKAKQFLKDKQRLEKRLKDQLEQEQEMLKEIDELNLKGNLIYEKFSELDELVNGLKKALNEHGEKYVREKISTSPKLKQLIKELNMKKKEITLNLE